MKRQIVGLLALLALVAMAKSDKMCEIEGVAVSIPDTYDCEKYVNERIESFRFPTFPWIRFPPILSTLLPLFPRWPTTPAPDSDENEFECPDDDIELIPHPYDCEKYVLCVFGERIKRRCAEGLEFSPEERTCMLPEDAECEPQDRVWECPEEDDLDNIVFLPNKEDCSKYYLCWGGEQIPLSCAKGLHWSISEEACMEEDEAECEFGDDDDYEECPDEGIKSISHPYNCEKYVLCVHGARIKRHCAPGFHFSRELRNCVDPDIADCHDRMTCPAEDDLDNIVFLPNLDDCGKYYVCWGGEGIPLSCAEGMHWSEENEQCMPKDEAGCEIDDFEECPDEGIKHISHPDDCGKYVLCVNSARIKRSCAPGLHFSRELRQCTTPDIAECDDDDMEECPDDGIKNISHPDDCGKYILCVNGARIKRSCAAGLHFSRELRQCTSPAIAECDDSEFTCPEEDDMDNLVFHPNTEDCSKYYVCWGGESIPLRCSDGLHWSTEANNCLPISVANCEFRFIEHCPDEGIKSVSHPDSCEKYVLCISGTRIERDCQPGFHFSRDFRMCVPPQIAGCEDGEELTPFMCPGIDDPEKLVFLPDPEDCEKHYLCHGGMRVPFSCHKGLHWNREKEMCMLPSDAGCKS